MSVQYPSYSSIHHYPQSQQSSQQNETIGTIAQPPKKSSVYQENKELFWAGAVALGIATLAILKGKNKAKVSVDKMYEKITSKMDRLEYDDLFDKMKIHLDAGRIPEDRDLILIKLKDSKEMIGLPKDIDADFAIGYCKNKNPKPGKATSLEDFELLELVKNKNNDETLDAIFGDKNLLVYERKTFKQELSEFNRYDEFDDFEETGGRGGDSWKNSKPEPEKPRSIFPLSKFRATKPTSDKYAPSGNLIHLDTIASDDCFTMNTLAKNLKGMLDAKYIPDNYDITVINIAEAQKTHKNLKGIKGDFMLGMHPKNNPQKLEPIMLFTPPANLTVFTEKTQNKNYAFTLKNDNKLRTWIENHLAR